MAKYLCTILNELGITQQGPTMIYRVSTAAIMMVNANKPNGCTHYINKSYFVLQEWVQDRKVELAHIRGVANPADALTKALSQTLHSCHVTQKMGHNENVYAHTSSRI
eukprot:2043832-Ditylum_brightwellii.AAC.1